MLGRIGRIGRDLANRFIGGSTPVSPTLVRESNGTVTVVSLASTYTPTLTRQPDGTATVGFLT